MMKQNGGSADRLTWKWTKGEPVTIAELANPLSSATYSLCIYAGTASAPIAIATVPPSLTKWEQLGPAGYAFKDKTGADSGVRKVVLKPSNQNQGKAILKGAGVNLPDPALGNLALPVTGQLINGSTGLCLEGRYESANVITNDAEKFKARGSSRRPPASAPTPAAADARDPSAPRRARRPTSSAVTRRRNGDRHRGAMGRRGRWTWCVGPAAAIIADLCRMPTACCERCSDNSKRARRYGHGAATRCCSRCPVIGAAG
jgi:hypothetical protein